VQTADAGHLRPIGSNGFYPRGGDRADFDQQPVDAWVSVAACIEAWFATQDDFWLRESRRAFDWFLGRNDLDQSLYDAKSGGCYDGLHFDRVNRNQGAESSLAFLLALQEMRQLDGTLETFVRPAKSPSGHPYRGDRASRNPARKRDATAI
jgi:hypothetical protein